MNSIVFVERKRSRIDSESSTKRDGLNTRMNPIGQQSSTDRMNPIVFVERKRSIDSDEEERDLFRRLVDRVIERKRNRETKRDGLNTRRIVDQSNESHRFRRSIE